MPTVVLGDFKQRLDGGRSRAVPSPRCAARRADFRLTTAELTDDPGHLLDHIAVHDIDAADAELIPQTHPTASDDRPSRRRQQHNRADQPHLTT